MSNSDTRIIRDDTLDFVRGLCVLGIIVHHCLDYFLTGTLLHRYMRFTSGSFLFLAGFVLTHVALPKYDMATDGKKFVIRYTVRGLKLIVLVIIINLFLKMIFDIKSFSRFDYSRVWFLIWDVLIVGNYLLIAFDLLIPIGYTIIAVGVISFLSVDRKWIIIIITILLVCICSVFFIDQSGAYNFLYLTIGLCGASIGLIAQDKIESPPLYILIIIFLVFISLLIYIPLGRLYYPIYILNVIANIFFFYQLGRRIRLSSFISKSMLILGRYSLFAYLFQIAILQFQRRIPPRLNGFTHNIFWVFFFTFVATIAASFLVDWLQSRSSRFKWLYRFIFS